MSKKAELKRSKTEAGTAPTGGGSKYFLTADFFDFLQKQDHPWRIRGNQLTISDVVDDPKHNTTVAKQQKKLQWLVEEMGRIAEDPTTALRPLQSQLSFILAAQHFETTLYQPLPKTKLKDDSIDGLKRLVTRMTVEAAKQLTADTRAVLHEFKNLQKTFEFVAELSNDIGVRFIDELTDESSGFVRTKEFLQRFQAESKKEMENYSRIKLPFTQDASHKLAICARHLRPLVAQALTVHAQDVYNAAYDLGFLLADFSARLKRKLDMIQSALPSNFLLFAAARSSSDAHLPRKFPRFLPNITLPDPDGFLVGDAESYRLILSAYADYSLQIEKLLPGWKELTEMLEMWQRTCVKANGGIQTKGPVPTAPAKGQRNSTVGAGAPIAAPGVGTETPPPRAKSTGDPLTQQPLQGGFSAAALLSPQPESARRGNPALDHEPLPKPGPMPPLPSEPTPQPQPPVSPRARSLTAPPSRSTTQMFTEDTIADLSEQLEDLKYM